MNHTATEVMEILQKAGIAAGKVQNFQDLTENDPQLQHRGTFFWLDHPVLEHELHFGWPVKLSSSPTQARRAPLLGEHTAGIFMDLLGISGEEYVQLISEGVIE